MYLAAVTLPSINTNGPILSLQKQPHTMIPGDFCTVGCRHSFLYFSSGLRHTHFFESLLNNSNRDSSLNTTRSHSPLHCFLIRHQANRFLRFASETKGFFFAVRP